MESSDNIQLKEKEKEKDKTMTGIAMLKRLNKNAIKKYVVKWLQGGYEWVETKFTQTTAIKTIKELQTNLTVDSSTIEVFIETHTGDKFLVYGNRE